MPNQIFLTNSLSSILSTHLHQTFTAVDQIIQQSRNGKSLKLKHKDKLTKLEYLIGYFQTVHE